MSSEIEQGNLCIPTFCVCSPLLENLSKENVFKLRKLGQRYDRLLRQGQDIFSRFGSELERSLRQGVRAVRDALIYDPTALSPAERQRWRDAHHQEVVPMLEQVCQELGWPADYVMYIAPMFYDDSPEIQQACFEQLFTGGSTGCPFISTAALLSDSTAGKSYHLSGPHSFELQYALSEVDDVVIKLNLKEINARGLRWLVSELLLMKESQEAGKAYGSVAGRPRGYRKRVLAGLTWNDIALIHRQEPKRFGELRERYVEEKLAQRKTEIWKGKEPGSSWLKGERQLLANNFSIRANRAEKRLRASGQS